MNKKEFEPFGEEWRKEMRQFTKEGLIDFLKATLINRKQYAKDMCKEQREICAKFFDDFPSSTEWRDTKSLREAIKNAPEPKELTK